MYVTTKTTISFDIVKDADALRKFLETKDSDWRESSTTQWMTYTKEQTFYQDGNWNEDSKEPIQNGNG